MKTIKADTMMYVCQLNDPRSGEQWVNVPAMEAMLKQRLGKTLLSYAYIIHDKDTVVESDVEAREQARERYSTRLYQERLGNLAKEQDPQNNVAITSLRQEATEYAQKLTDEKFPAVTLGALKPAHIHLVMRLKENRDVDVVARWFKDVAPTLPELIQVYKDNVRKSGDRIKNALEYLVHKNAAGKFQYAPEEVVASFDYVKHLKDVVEIETAHAQYRVTPDEVNDFINLIADNQKTRADFISQFSYAIYSRNATHVDKAEAHRISRFAKVPARRKVGYFDSNQLDKARIGKTTAACEVARQLAIKQFGAPEDVFTDVESVKSPNPYVYICGQNTLFEGYTNQPIVIFDDFRAGDLKSAFKSRAAIKNFLDPHPASQRYNVKFSSVLPVVEYVLITGIDEFDDFIRSLSTIKAKDEEDDDDMVTQFLGRFWFRCTFEDGERYVVYLNNEFYPIEGCETRFYHGLPAPCSVFRVMNIEDKDVRNRALEKTFLPLYRQIVAFGTGPDNIITDDDLALLGESITTVRPLTMPKVTRFIDSRVTCLIPPDVADAVEERFEDVHTIMNVFMDIYSRKHSVNRFPTIRQALSQQSFVQELDAFDPILHLALEKHVKAAEAAAQAYVKTYSMTGSNANIRFHSLNAALRSQSFLIALKRDEAVAFDVLHRCGYIV